MTASRCEMEEAETKEMSHNLAQRVVSNTYQRAVTSKDSIVDSLTVE